MKAYGGVVSFMPLLLYRRGTSPRYPLDTRLGGPQRLSGRYREEKKLSPVGNRTPAVQSNAIPTELSGVERKVICGSKIKVFCNVMTYSLV
jgi:hypothetical protein